MLATLPVALHVKLFDNQVVMTLTIFHSLFMCIMMSITRVAMLFITQAAIIFVVRFSFVDAVPYYAHHIVNLVVALLVSLFAVQKRG